ncbi:hypothetical protein ATANTOWER_022074 [Ataeniobius toweri]|uniref:Uncharacterized protein n=1 Tax=Ataeniobius toweri TaxID=208326 RepID=A0ABU7C0L0_9TELE|nr:hypothetical protein [Ataeniobius toweri]
MCPRSLKTVSFSSVQNRENMRNRCSQLINKEGNSSPWEQTSVGFHRRLGVGRVFDRFMNLLTFLYQTKFHLSSSSGKWPCGGKVNSPASFYLSKDASDVLSHEIHWKWQPKFVSLRKPCLEGDRELGMET